MNEGQVLGRHFKPSNVSLEGVLPHIGGSANCIRCAIINVHEIRSLQISGVGNIIHLPPHRHAARRREVVDDSEFVT